MPHDPGDGRDLDFLPSYGALLQLLEHLGSFDAASPETGDDVLGGLEEHIGDDGDLPASSLARYGGGELGLISELLFLIGVGAVGEAELDPYLPWTQAVVHDGEGNPRKLGVSLVLVLF